jgi:hypothetical protein
VRWRCKRHTTPIHIIYSVIHIFFYPIRSKRSRDKTFRTCFIEPSPYRASHPSRALTKICYETRVWPVWKWFQNFLLKKIPPTIISRYSRRSRLHTTLDQAIAAIPCPCVPVSLGSSLRASSLDDETASSLRKRQRSCQIKWKATVRAHDKATDLPTLSLQKKRQANRQSKRESGFFFVTEGYSRPTDQPAKQIIEQTFCLKKWQSRLTEQPTKGFFSIDEGNHYRVLNSTEAGTVLGMSLDQREISLASHCGLE